MTLARLLILVYSYFAFASAHFNYPPLPRALPLGAANSSELIKVVEREGVKYDDFESDTPAVAHAQLGETAFAKAWAAGNAMTREQAINYALEGGTRSDKPQLAPEAGQRASPSLIDSLSEREIEVLRLIAEGLSNRDIADTLTVTKSTVRTHVYHLCQKLSARNRTQAVARARALRIL